MAERTISGTDLLVLVLFGLTVLVQFGIILFYWWLLSPISSYVLWAGLVKIFTVITLVVGIIHHLLISGQFSRIDANKEIDVLGNLVLGLIFIVFVLIAFVFEALITWMLGNMLIDSTICASHSICQTIGSNPYAVSVLYVILQAVVLVSFEMAIGVRLADIVKSRMASLQRFFLLFIDLLTAVPSLFYSLVMLYISFSFIYNYDDDLIHFEFVGYSAICLLVTIVLGVYLVQELLSGVTKTNTIRLLFLSAEVIAVALTARSFMLYLFGPGKYCDDFDFCHDSPTTSLLAFYLSLGFVAYLTSIYAFHFFTAL